MAQEKYNSWYSQLSVENLRKLNKMHLMAIEIPLLDDLGATDKNNASVNGIPGGKAPWHVSLYSMSGVSLDGKIEVSAPMGDLLGGITKNKVASTLMQVAGLSPQMDFSAKYQFMGSSPLEFTVQGALVLESDPEIDYVQNIRRLCYLAYPMRAFPITLNSLFDAVDAAIKKFDADKTKFGQMVMNLRSNVGAIYNVCTGMGWDEAQKQGMQGWDTMASFFSSVMGPTYALMPPPTFDWLRSGSGLDFKYGSTLVSDVYIKSLNFNIPTLYYEGGWPAYIGVTMTLGTFRRITQDLVGNMIQGIPQNIESDKKQREAIYKNLKDRYAQDGGPRGWLFEQMEDWMKE